MVSVPSVNNRVFFIINKAEYAIAIPIKIPKKICLNNRGIIPVVLTPLTIVIPNIVKMYAKGSLLPLSISRRGAVLYFKLSRLERNMEKTDAASVELITAPIKKLSVNGSFRIYVQKRVQKPAVKIVPKEDNKIACKVTFLSSGFFVQKPP